MRRFPTRRKAELRMVTSLRLHDASPLPGVPLPHRQNRGERSVSSWPFLRSFERGKLPQLHLPPPSGKLGAARSCLRALGGVVLLQTMRRFALCLPHRARRRDRRSRIIVEIVRVQLFQNRITIALDAGRGAILAQPGRSRRAVSSVRTQLVRLAQLHRLEVKTSSPR